MTVMCIQKFFFTCGICGDPMPGPEVGDRDIVIDVVQPKKIAGTYYALEGFGKDNMFNSKCFAIVPDVTEELLTANKTTEPWK